MQSGPKIITRIHPTCVVPFSFLAQSTSIQIQKAAKAKKDSTMRKSPPEMTFEKKAIMGGAG